MRPKLALQEKARKLRAQGWSYKEICEIVPVTKSSISLWCSDIPLTKIQRIRLKKLSLGAAARGRKTWADLRRATRQELLRKLAKQAQSDIGTLSKRERFVAGIMLYAGEGDKTQERIGMANSNPAILQFMLEWFIEFLELDRDHFHVHLYLHVGRSEPKAREFWAKTLRIRKSQIVYVYRPEPRPSHKGNIHKFGVCSIRFHNGLAHRRLMAWVRAVLNSPNQIFPGSSMAEQVAVKEGSSYEQS